jgi:hypothetical protein
MRWERDGALLDAETAVGDEVGDRGGKQHFARGCCCGELVSHVDGTAAVPIIAMEALTRVDAHADLVSVDLVDDP